MKVRTAFGPEREKKPMGKQRDKKVVFFSAPCFLTVSDRFEGAFCLWGEFGAKQAGAARPGKSASEPSDQAILETNPSESWLFGVLFFALRSQPAQKNTELLFCFSVAFFLKQTKSLLGKGLHIYTIFYGEEGRAPENVFLRQVGDPEKNLFLVYTKKKPPLALLRQAKSCSFDMMLDVCGACRVRFYTARNPKIKTHKKSQQKDTSHRATGVFITVCTP